VLQRDVVDQLHDDDGLADAGAAEQADLAAREVRLEQVDDLDARLEHLQLGRLLFERRRMAVNRPALLRLDGLIGEVHRLAEHVQHASERRGAHRHRDARARVDRAHAALQAVGRLHRDRAHAVLAEVLFDLADDVDLLGRVVVGDDVHGVVDLGKPAFVFDVDDRPDDLDDLADLLLRLRFSSDCHVFFLKRFRA
jgi:peptide chain release factor 1